MLFYRVLKDMGIIDTIPGALPDMLEVMYKVVICIESSGTLCIKRNHSLSSLYFRFLSELIPPVRALAAQYLASCLFANAVFASCMNTKYL